MLPEDAKRLRANGAIFIDRKAVRGYGENTPGWMRILTKGLAAIRKEAEDALAKLDDANPGDLEKSFFYKAEIKAADAVILLAHRHADLAEKMAAECDDPVRKAELLKIAEVTRHVPEYPARTFYEACQSIISYEYACFMEQNASSYNLGRLDQYLYPYYKKDKEAGILTDDDAQELLDCLWIKVAEMSLFQDESQILKQTLQKLAALKPAGGLWIARPEMPVSQKVRNQPGALSLACSPEKRNGFHVHK